MGQADTVLYIRSVVSYGNGPGLVGRVEAALSRLTRLHELWLPHRQRAL
jgi:hypothetical protein